MKTNAIIPILCIALVLGDGIFFALHHIKKKVEESFKGKTASGYFLNDFDLDDGEYVLLVKHPEKGLF